VKNIILLRSFAGLSRKALPAGFVRRARALAGELAAAVDVVAIEREVSQEEVPA
jgi:hypothetical protein